MFIPLYTYCQLLVDNLAAHCETNVKKSVFYRKNAHVVLYTTYPLIHNHIHIAL